LNTGLTVFGKFNRHTWRPGGCCGVEKDGTKIAKRKEISQKKFLLSAIKMEF
jgi:hypothetical protein